MSIAGVTRELLVRYLDAWAPAVLSGSKRATFAQSWAGPADVYTAEAALRVFAEFADLLRRHQLSIVLVAELTAEWTGRLDKLVAELRLPAQLSVHAITGNGDEQLP